MDPKPQRNIKKQLLCGMIIYVAVFSLLILLAYGQVSKFEATTETQASQTGSSTQTSQSVTVSGNEQQGISEFIMVILGHTRPILMGFAFAYLCNPIFRFFERKLFYRLRPSALRRTIALICTYLVAFGAVALLVVLIFPIAMSLTDLFREYDSYVNSAINSVNSAIADLNSLTDRLIGKEDFFNFLTADDFWNTLRTFLLDSKSGFFLNFGISEENVDFAKLMSTVFGSGKEIAGMVTDSIFAFFISVYFLSTKEKRYAQIMKLRHAIFSNRVNQRITKICTTADNLFGKFFEGKLLDSLIVGILLYIFLSIFGVPYALLISVITAIFNIVPIVGYLISIVPGGLLVFLDDPDKLLPFLLIVFIIYLIDMNIISPKLLGNNTGVGPLCVIVSISLISGLMGYFIGPVGKYIGLVVAVPLAATFLDFLDSVVHRRLQAKRLPDDVENYYAPDPIMNLTHSAPGYARFMQRFEKKALHARSLMRRGLEDQMTSFDKSALKFYVFGQRIKLFKEPSPEILTQFSAEDAERTLRRSAAQMRERYLTAKSKAHSLDSTEGGDAK